MNILFLGCASQRNKADISVDKLPEQMSFIYNEPAFKGLTLNEEINPFYIRMDQGSDKQTFVLLTKDANSRQVLLLCRDGHLERKTSKDLGLKEKQRILYFKETVRFPSGAALSHTGSGIVVVLSGKEIRWVFYKNGWQIIDPL